MISSVSLEWFLPFGQQIIQNYVGDASSSNDLTCVNVGIPSAEHDQERKPTNIKWLSRINSDGVEEELYIYGKNVILSYGDLKTSIPETETAFQPTRMLYRLYTSEHDFTDALWCSFDENANSRTCDALEIKNDTQKLNAVVTLDSEHLGIYPPNSEEQHVPLPFKVSTMLRTKFGLLLQRDNTEKKKNVLPVLYSLTHPLNDIKPFLVSDRGGEPRYMRKSSLALLFTCENPSICVWYDHEESIHKVWKIRKVSDQELDNIRENEAAMFEQNTSSLLTPNLSNFPSLCGSRMKKENWVAYDTTPSAYAESTNTFQQRRTSVTRNETSSLFQMISYRSIDDATPCSSRSQSYSAHLVSTPSAIARSPFSVFSFISDRSSTPNISKKQKLSISQPDYTHSSTTTCIGVDNSSFVSIPPVPLYPELCLEFLWQDGDDESLPKLNIPATKVFVCSDFIKNQFLCFLHRPVESLFCVSMNVSDDKVTFGHSTRLPAKDAAPIEHGDMMIVLNKSGTLELYSGINYLAQIAWSDALSQSFLDFGFSYEDTDLFSDSVDVLSNILSSTRVGGVISTDEPSVSPIDWSQVQSLKSLDKQSPDTFRICSIACVTGLQVVLNYSDGRCCRILVPPLYTFPLIKHCMNALQSISSSCALTVAGNFYVTRNAPGPQNIPLEQEWSIFLQVVLRLLGYDVNTVPPVMKCYVKLQAEGPVVSKKIRKSSEGDNSDWLYLLDSKYHSKNFTSTCSTLTSKTDCWPKNPVWESVGEQYTINNDGNLAPLRSHYSDLHHALHLLYEDFKLNTLYTDYLPLLATLLFQMAQDMGLKRYMLYYWSDFSHLFGEQSVLVKNITPLVSPSVYNEISVPISTFKYLVQFLTPDLNTLQPYPVIRGVNDFSRCIIQLINFWRHPGDVSKLQLFKGAIDDTDKIMDLMESYATLPRSYKTSDRIVALMVKAGITSSRVLTLPPGVAWYFLQHVHTCRQNPPDDFTHKHYKLLQREDLAFKDPSYRPMFRRKMAPIIIKKQAAWLDDKHKEVSDGMDGIENLHTNLRWTRDNRAVKVRQILNSSTPVTIDLPPRPESNSQQIVEDQEKHLYTLSSRTLALPVGRGIFTLHTLTPSMTEPLQIPKLCLTGKSGSTGVSVDFSHIEVPANMNMWPAFHNGVAAGLRINPVADISTAWISFNKDPRTDTSPEHAGFLMGLGLSGILKNMPKVYMFEYLSKYHDLTAIALIIGLSASLRGTMDPTLTKLLSLHVESLLPPTSVDLDITHQVQVAALLGVGLLYQETANMHMADVLLSEIGRPPGLETDNSQDRESYSLAAGFALGLVLLGKGNTELGSLERTNSCLRRYMVGGLMHSSSASQNEKFRSTNFNVREDEYVNLDVMAPAATMALALIYFNTKNKTVGSWMKIPDTLYGLDYLCPDFLLQRTLAYNLIFWDDIVPSVAWIETFVPPIIRPYCLRKPRGIPAIDLESINQAYCNIISGACLALGLKYAGTNNSMAHQAIRFYCNKLTSLSGKSLAELAGKATVETAINTILLAMSLIVAGTGSLNLMSVCDTLGSRVGQGANTAITYGSHLAVHMALGLSFLGYGKYSLSTKPRAIAALLIACYPKFPIHSNDNRYHLQAFRHLYVLATEPRLVLSRDIDTGDLIYLRLRLSYRLTTDLIGETTSILAPCIIPELRFLEKVVVDDERYWPIEFDRGKNWDQFKKIVKNSYLDVKQRVGVTPYYGNMTCLRNLLQTANVEPSFSAISWSEILSKGASCRSDFLLNLRKSFVDGVYANLEMPKEERLFCNIFLSALEQYLNEDKIDVIPHWLNIVHILNKAYDNPDGMAAKQIRLFDQLSSWCRRYEEFTHLSPSDDDFEVDMKEGRLQNSMEDVLLMAQEIKQEFVDANKPVIFKMAEKFVDLGTQVGELGTRICESNVSNLSGVRSCNKSKEVSEPTSCKVIDTSEWFLSRLDEHETVYNLQLKDILTSSDGDSSYNQIRCMIRSAYLTFHDLFDLVCNNFRGEHWSRNPFRLRKLLPNLKNNAVEEVTKILINSENKESKEEINMAD